MSKTSNILNIEVKNLHFHSSSFNPPPNNKNDMIDWWIGTVLLTFFPIIISIIICLCQNGSVDFKRMIGDGELILSAFLVITPSIMKFYKTSSNQNRKNHKLFFYILLFVAFFQLTAYSSIKTASNNRELVVYITSGLCVLSSILISFRGEIFLTKEDNK